MSLAPDSPRTRVGPEFTIPNGIPKNSYCPSGVKRHYFVHILWCNQYMPVTFGQINLGQVFFVTEAMEQVSSHRHGFRLYFSDLVQLPKVNIPCLNHLSS